MNSIHKQLFCEEPLCSFLFRFSVVVFVTDLSVPVVEGHKRARSMNIESFEVGKRENT